MIVYGTTTKCNNCGDSWNMYSDDGVPAFHEGEWFTGGKCPTCSVYKCIKITKADGFEYNKGDYNATIS